MSAMLSTAGLDSASSSRVAARTAERTWALRPPGRRLGATVPAGDVEDLRAAVVEAKAGLGRAEIERRFDRQVEWSDRVIGAIARASGKRRRRCQVELVVSGCAADRLPDWYMARLAADDEAAFLAACPDHHLFRPTPDGGQEVWETTGGSPIASRFFFNLDDHDGIVTPADPAYPEQMAAAARLADGTLIGGIRHQVRDEGDGLRALLTVEFPSLIGPVSPAAHRWHLASEFARWFEAAAADPR